MLVLSLKQWLETLTKEGYDYVILPEDATPVSYTHLYWMPEFTHVSIQDEAPVLSSTASATLRKIYRKPVIGDEVGYEGNLPCLLYTS